MELAELKNKIVHTGLLEVACLIETLGNKVDALTDDEEVMGYIIAKRLNELSDFLTDSEGIICDLIGQIAFPRIEKELSYSEP